MLIYGGPVELANNLVYGAATIIGAYVFGAGWDDANVMKYSARGHTATDLGDDGKSEAPDYSVIK